MKLKDFLKWCEENQMSGEETIGIHSVGCIGGAIPFKNASVGFDWDNGKIVLHTDHPMTIYKRIEKPKPNVKEIIKSKRPRK